MGVQEKSLRVYDTKKTFFSKIGTTFGKIFGSSKAGVNNFVVNAKRNTAIKNYKKYLKASSGKEDLLEKTFENSFTIYLESIDELIINAIYKKVTLGTATPFEREALSKYYTVIHTKENDLDEYKIRKQIYLLDLDYNLLREMEKTKLLNEFMPLYLYKMERFYKGLLKRYSMLLTEKSSQVKENVVFDSIFKALEEYVEEIIPLEENKDEGLLKDYSEYETYSVGKLDQIDTIDKNMILLGISRRKFVHSLPLVVSERCYQKLLQDVRDTIVDSKIDRKIEGAYQLFIKLVEQYYDRLLSVKIYWDNNDEKKAFNLFKEKKDALKDIKAKSGIQEYERQKQILYIRTDISNMERYKIADKNEAILQFYRTRLVNLGDMRQLKNYIAITHGKFRGGKLEKGALEHEKAC